MSALAFAYTCLHPGRSVKLRIMLALAVSLIGLVFLIFSEPVAAETSPMPGSGFLLSQSYYVDPSGSADFTTIRGANFKSFEGSLSKGYISGAVWLKLRVAATSVDQSLVIIVEPPFLQRLELYDPTRQGSPAGEPVVSGQDERSEVGTFDGIDNGFVIPGSRTEREFFVRVASATSILVNVRILTQNEARNANTSTLTILGVYVALLVMFAIWGCVSLIIKRESIYGYFALRQVSSIAHAFAFFGFIRIFFADNMSLAAREAMYGLIIVTSFTFSGLFDFKIIAQHRPSKLLHFIFGAILCFPVISVTLVVQGYIGEALFLNKLALNVCLATLLLLAMSVRGMTDSPLERLAVWVIRIGYLITTVTVLLPVLMYLNILPGDSSSIKLIFIHAIVSNIVMLTLLMIQNRQRDLFYQQAALQVKVKDVELTIENKKREDKERFLSMIIHELRNPLSVVRLLTDKYSEKGQSVYEAAMDMAKVIERVEQSEKLSSGKLVIERSHVDIMNEIRELLGERKDPVRWKLIGPERHIVETDQYLLKVVMTNLFDNAENYSPEGSLLHVRVGKAEGDRHMSVVEVANGVQDFCVPDPARVFERYYRSKGAHRTPGSGLGLFLVQGWVEAMGGHVACRLSVEESGKQEFTVSLRLPS